MSFVRRKHLKRRNRKVPAALALCLLTAVFVGAAAFFDTHFFVHFSGFQAASALGSAAPSAPAPAASRPSAPSSAAAASAAVKAVQVSLQDAVQPLWIHVSLEDQTLAVEDAEEQVVQNWLCSTGSPGYETPKGTFSVYKRGKSFFNPEYEEGAYYYVAFYKDFYIHSVPFDKDRKIIPAIADDLGHPDSHGCVHLTVEDSEWVYDHIPDGTKVVID